VTTDSAAGPTVPARSLAACVAQSFLRALGIDITFNREGQAGNRIIRMRALSDNTVCTVSSVREGQDNVRHDRRVTSGTTAAAPIGHSARSGKSPSQSLTVLTQMPGFSFSGSRSEDYAGMGPRWPTAGASGRNHHTASVPPEIFEPVRAHSV
jgi:hypothetical protein